MSCLNKQYRLNQSNDFNRIYKSGKKWHTPSFVAFFDSGVSLKMAFVTSKKVGCAVIRSKSRQRLRAVVMLCESRLKIGNYIFVLKREMTNRNFEELKRDLDFALKRLKLYR